MVFLSGARATPEAGPDGYTAAYVYVDSWRLRVSKKTTRFLLRTILTLMILSLVTLYGQVQNPTPIVPGPGTPPSPPVYTWESLSLPKGSPLHLFISLRIAA